MLGALSIFAVKKLLLRLNSIFHVDIINGKVWVQEDATDFDLVGELEERGIPKSDIVLAFQAPYKRPHTGYAIA